ncbi:hypothetical protein PLICRDRAFT_35323 [Plicaturopsis crispa FD-325 SS-3]|nr:hypothetical protein PLICRDRAFT_35323 [Plicaturopsis crispa FD-325 SS-3]
MLPVGRRAKKQAKAAATGELMKFLQAPETLQRLDELQLEDLRDTTPRIQQLLDDVHRFYDGKATQKVSNMETLISVALERSKMYPSLQLPFERLLRLQREASTEVRTASSQASHREKRRLVRQLGLGSKPFAGGNLLDPKICQTLHETDSARVVWRLGEREPSSNDTRNPEFVAETGSGADNTVLMNDPAEFYAVKPDETAIFLSKENGGKVQVEQAVLRDAATGATFSPAVFEWLSKLVGDSSKCGTAGTDSELTAISQIESVKKEIMHLDNAKRKLPDSSSELHASTSSKKQKTESELESLYRSCAGSDTANLEEEEHVPLSTNIKSEVKTEDVDIFLDAKTSEDSDNSSQYILADHIRIILESLQAAREAQKAAERERDEAERAREAGARRLSEAIRERDEAIRELGTLLNAAVDERLRLSTSLEVANNARVAVETKFATLKRTLGALAQAE